MFNIGDKIVYPMYGAGVIQSIEEKEFLGEKKQYYKIKLLTSNMEVMIPLDRILSSNIRPINDESSLEDILLSFNSCEVDSNNTISSKQRYQANLEKVKSGLLKEGIEVIRDLTHINNEKTLNTSEKQLLNTARKFFISEIVLIKGLTEQEASYFLDERLS